MPKKFIIKTAPKMVGTNSKKSVKTTKKPKLKNFGKDFEDSNELQAMQAEDLELEKQQVGDSDSDHNDPPDFDIVGETKNFVGKDMGHDDDDADNEEQVPMRKANKRKKKWKQK